MLSATAPAPDPLAPDLRINPLRYEAVETFRDHFKRYLEAAKNAAHEATLSFGKSERDRAHQLVISAWGLNCVQADRVQLTTAIETLTHLGFNAVQIDQCKPLTANETTPILDRFGFRSNFMLEVSDKSAPGQVPFDYFHFKRRPGDIQVWAAKSMRELPTEWENDPRRLTILILADEPNWSSKDMDRKLREGSNQSWFSRFRAAFNSFLQSSVTDPAQLGSAQWETIEPLLECDPQAPLTDRRRFYWSVRFLIEQAALGMEEAGVALDPRLPKTMNLNDARWYQPRDPVAGYGMYSDWFLIGRRHVLTLFFEDWGFKDKQAQNWSFYGDLLRTATMGKPFGGYVVGITLGHHRAGAAYKILALLGHGAKQVLFWTWGNLFSLPENSWSNRLFIYPQIAAALRLVGRADHVLAPGKRAPGRVALLFPGSSDLWFPKIVPGQPIQNRPLHSQEFRYLHYALTHAGYTCDIVDETELSGAAWRYRGYTTLYVTGANVALAAQEQIRQWVDNDGGTLVVMPGAGVADEYNEPTTIFDDILGLQPRARVPLEFEEIEPSDLRSVDYDPVLDELVGHAVEPNLTGVSVHGVIAPLVARDPTDPSLVVLARFKSAGGPAIIRHASGKGIAYAYGFPAGRSYWRTPNRYRYGLPRNWNATARFAAILPVERAGTPRPVIVSQEGVEACQLESATGIAIVLLNWTDVPIPNLTVTLPDSGQLWRVVAASGKSVGRSSSTSGFHMTLDLHDVDILILTPLQH